MAPRILLVIGVATCVLAGPGAIRGIDASDQLPQRDGQRPGRAAADTGQEPTGTATLSGTVIADATSARIRLANVVLIGATTGVLRVTSTDAAGRFSFSRLPPDRYTVGASKLPYLGAAAGARRPVRPGAPVTLADGATRADVLIRLPMGAAISGVIYDERGQPASGISVALQRWTLRNGQQLLEAAGRPVVTDDRGAYRAYGLAPGEYFVAATPPRPAANARVLTDAEVDSALAGTIASAGGTSDAAMALAPVYHPGTARMEHALPVTLVTGEDRQNVDVRLERTRIGHIEGTVVSGDGQAMRNATVTIAAAAGSRPLRTNAATQTRQDGRFSFAAPPGSYTLLARIAGPEGTRFATADVRVAGADVSGIQLTLQPTLSLTGTLTVAGTAVSLSLGGHRIAARPVGGPMAGTDAPPSGTTTATGAFSIEGLVPGPYVIGSALVPGPSAAGVRWGLESVMVDGRDVTDLPVTISADAGPGRAAVTIGNRWQAVSGQLTNGQGAGISDYLLVLFPVNDAYWLYDSRRIRTAQPTADGRFTLGGPGPGQLPAGEYYLSAVTDVSKDEQYDPAFLRSLVSASIRITLAPGQRLTQNVRVR